MSNTSLVLGSRRYSRRWMLLGLVASCAIAAAADTKIAEPLSLVALGASLITMASGLRKYLSKPRG